MTDFTETELSFTARDSLTLGGTLFAPPKPRLGILISPATGFPQRFYHPIARFLAAQGATVLTYDYRGIGKSKVADLAQSGIDIPDWGRLDLSAAIDTLEQHAPGLPLTHLCHSVGGHLIGLAPNHAKLQRHAFLAVGSGHWGHNKPHYVPLAMYFWWLLGSYNLARHGYFAKGYGWAGRALPPLAFKTWRRWAHHPDYMLSEMDSLLAPHDYAGVTAPIQSWIFPDDPIATPKAAKLILRAYPNAESALITRKPADFSMKRIGHEGAFLPGRAALWDEIWQWLQADLA